MASLEIGQLHAPPDPRREPGAGRRAIAVIGIDRYSEWPRLGNAVNDARGALDRFRRLGFEALPGTSLFDEAASGEAIHKLVTDDLRLALGPEDSLVLFFAGHGCTLELGGSKPVTTGYLIGADGALPGGAISQWVRLDTWLSDVSRLPARHILVILDACRSGVALDALIKHRDVGVLDVGARSDDVLGQLRARRSRRVITSALDGQRALDSGPVPGHSLFTGYLIEALERGLGRGEPRIATGSELGLYLQRRVGGHSGSEQTPDFGALELDDRGELILELDPIGPSGGGSIIEPRGRSTRWPRARLAAAAAGLAIAALLVLPGYLRGPATHELGQDARSGAGGVDAASDAHEAQADDAAGGAAVVQPPDARLEPPADGGTSETAQPPGTAPGGESTAPVETAAYRGPCRLETYGEVTAGGPSEQCATAATPAQTKRARALGEQRAPKLHCTEVYRCR